jgi:hypothetical protein
MSAHHIDAVIAAVTSLLILLTSGLILLSVTRRRMAERHQLRLALLEKLSNEDMVRLLETEGGRAWLRDVLAGPSNPRAGIQPAMMVVFAGIGCGAAAVLVGAKVLGVFGLIVLAVGTGQLLAVLLLSRPSKAGAMVGDDR